MKIYISGAITDDPHYLEKFARVEKHLIVQGLEVVNPCTLPHNHGKTEEEFMREDLTELLKCDAIFMIRDWKDSRGANFEHDTAAMCGIEILYGEYI